MFSRSHDTDNLKKRSTITRPFTHGNDAQKKKDAKGGNYTGMLDRFLKSPRYRKSQEEHGWDEAKCAEMDRLAQEESAYKLTRSEYLRYSSIWCLQLNKSGSIAPMATRPDYRAAVALKNHLHRNSERLSKTNPTTRSRPSTRRQ